MLHRASTPGSAAPLPRFRVLALAALALLIAACETPGPATRPEQPAAAATPSTGAEAPPAPPATLPATPSLPAAGTTEPEAPGGIGGSYRARAQTEYALVNGVRAPLERFADIAALQTFLEPQNDQVMHRRYPHLADAGPDAAQRVAEELHNVSVVAYLHAVKRDIGPRGAAGYLLVLGSSPTPGMGLFLAAAASAAPAAGAQSAQLVAARQQLLSIIGECRCESRFAQIAAPIAVRVTGSLFFDAAHAVGSIGPAYAQPFTAWEIRPILTIERLDVRPGAAAASAATASSSPGAIALPTSAAAVALRDRYATLRQRLEHSPFQQRLHLESVESSSALRGDAYGLLDYPFATMRDAFTSPAHWCDALILHVNVKYCRAVVHDKRTTLSVAVGRKYDQPLEDTFRLEFAFNATTSTADYMQIDLGADRGPLGTRDYHLVLEAVELEDARTFLHLRYSYGFGFLGRLAMKGYLATGGKGKVGFTRIDGAVDGAPRYVDGVRGAVERNTMRYYLAIDAYLDALATPAPQRFDHSLDHWFAATERYALQLHEIDRDAYLAMKRREYQRQQASR